MTTTAQQSAEELAETIFALAKAERTLIANTEDLKTTLARKTLAERLEALIQ